MRNSFRRLIHLALAAAEVMTIIILSDPPARADSTPAVQTSNSLADEVVWPSQEPLIFRRRRSGYSNDETEQYRRQYTEENMKRIVDLGVTSVRSHFYKGFGLKAERPEIENDIKLARYLHQHGVQYHAYMQWMTMTYETFFSDYPESKNWYQRDYSGKPIMLEYGHQYFRYKPCFNQEGYRNYMKEVIRVAIEEVGADIIGWDNMPLSGEPESCWCDACLEKFNKFIRSRYDDEALLERIGFTDLTYVHPPMFNRANPPEEVRVIRDPIMQEWLEFRCWTQTDAFGDMNRYAKTLKPNVMIQTNIHGISLNNRAWANGIEHSQICNAEYLDAWGGEEPTDAILLDGKVVSKIRNFKVARTLGNSSYNRGGVLRMAVAMAFNSQKKIPGYGYVGVPSPSRRFAGDEDPGQDRYRKFFLGRIADYQDTENIADVAILRGHASLAYNNYSPHVSTALAEQVLIQAKIPFDIIFDRNLADLSKYKVLLLANQESLTDEQVEIIRKFVSGGGGLVMTEASGLYDGWRRQRSTFALNDLFGNKLTRPPRYDIFDPDVVPPGRPVMVSYGRGRAAYIPRIIPAEPIPFETLGWAIQLDLPRNWPEIVEAVKWTGRGLSIEVHAPLTVVAEYLRKPSTGQLMLHLVNFDSESTLSGIPVELVPPKGRKVRSVRLYSPDGQNDVSLVFDADRGGVEFMVPELKLYDLILIETG